MPAEIPGGKALASTLRADIAVTTTHYTRDNWNIIQETTVSRPADGNCNDREMSNVEMRPLSLFHSRRIHR